jgi:hypothetical protein
MTRYPRLNGRTGIAVALLLSGALGSNIAAAASASCDVQLAVELTPDVPNPRTDGFLSSLLGNHTQYRLTLQQQADSSDLVLELTGPGPEYRCHDVVEDLRKDGRVLSVHASDEPA